MCSLEEKTTVGLTKEAPASCEEAKRTVKQVQVLGIYDPALPGELDVHVTGRGCHGVSGSDRGGSNYNRVLVPGMERAWRKIQPNKETAPCHLPYPVSNRAYSWRLCCKGADHGVAAGHVSHPVIWCSTDTNCNKMECLPAAETSSFNIPS